MNTLKNLLLALLLFFSFLNISAAQAKKDVEPTEKTTLEPVQDDKKATDEKTKGNEDSNAELKEAEQFIRELGADAIHVLTAKKDNPAEQKKEFEEIFINHFAVKSIATFVLGRYRRTAATEEKKEFFDLFKKSIADVYTERFKNYENESFVVTHARPAGGKSSLIRVYSEIKKPNSNPIEVEWKVFKKEDGKFCITDVIVEGLSMSTTQRSEYSSIIENNGGSVADLNRILKKRLAE